MYISERARSFDAEIFGALNLVRQELESEGRAVWDLSVGTPDFEPPAHVIEALRRSAKDPANWKYALHDKPALLDAVSAYYRDRFGVPGITGDMIASCRGTQEGLVHLCAALADPGDTVLLPDPCYPVFKNSAQLAGLVPVFYPLSAEHNFLPYVQGISDEVADRARYMIVSLPANPVGSVGTPELYHEIIAFARAHNLVIIHDNAYADIVFDGKRGGSFLAYEGAHEVGVEFLSLSKSFNVTGARLSFLVGRADVVAAASRLRSQIDFGMFLPEQDAAIAALTGPKEQLKAQCLEYQRRRDALCDGLEQLGWDRPSAHGSMFVWARIPGGRQDSAAFVAELAARSGVLATPGASFGPGGEGYVRFALVLPAEDLARAVQSIQAAGF